MIYNIDDIVCSFDGTFVHGKIIGYDNKHQTYAVMWDEKTYDYKKSNEEMYGWTDNTLIHSNFIKVVNELDEI